jgi:hypothetical protein
MTHGSASGPAKCDRTRVGPRPNCAVVHGDHGVGDVLQKPSAGLQFSLDIGAGIGHDRRPPLPGERAAKAARR